MALSAFFSGMEIAFVSSNRLLAEMDKEKDGIAQKCLTIYYNNPNGFVSTMLVGNKIVLVIYGRFFAQLFDTTLFASLTRLHVWCWIRYYLHLSFFLQVSSCQRLYLRAIRTDYLRSLLLWRISFLLSFGLLVVLRPSLLVFFCVWSV